MFLLPTFNARLQPCPVSAAAFTPHAQGQFCGQCQRVVQDFSQSANPVADLAAARAASPDGRVCGSFRTAQVQRPKLTQRLRWFVVALVLVVGQGLTAREALAQVRKGAAQPRLALPEQRAAIVPPEPPTGLYDANPNIVYGVVVEQMPELRKGGGLRQIIQYIQQRVVWPSQDGKIIEKQGKVFASFKVGADGRVRGAKIVKSLHPLFDAEVLRVVRALPHFIPGQQNGKPVSMDFTVPITFTLE